MLGQQTNLPDTDIMNEISVATWIEKFDNGDFGLSDTATQIEAGWYDWFCRDSYLVKKTAKLGKLVKKIAQSSKINKDTMYVWFKNNCPLCGNTYDDFRFADIESGDVVFTIVPKSGHSCDNGKAEVWGFNNEGKWEQLVYGTWRDVEKYFGV